MANLEATINHDFHFNRSYEEICGKHHENKLTDLKKKSIFRAPDLEFAIYPLEARGQFQYLCFQNAFHVL